MAPKRISVAGLALASTRMSRRWAGGHYANRTGARTLGSGRRRHVRPLGQFGRWP